MRSPAGLAVAALRPAGLVAGSVCALAVLAFALLHTPAVRAWVIATVVARLDDAGVGLRAGRLDYNLLALRIHLYDVELAAAPEPAPPVLSAAEIHATFGWRVLAGDIDIRRIEVVRPRVLIARGPDGRLNWSTSTGSSGPERAHPRIQIHQAVVRDLRVRWQDDPSATTLEAGLSADLASADGALSGPIVMSGPARLTWRGHETSFSEITGQLSWREPDLSITGLSIRAPEGSLLVEGRLDDLTGAPRIDARIGADINLAELLPWMQMEGEASGTLRADARVAGPLAEPAATIDVAGGIVPRALPPVAVDGSVRLSAGGADLLRFRADGAGGVLSAQGRTAFGGPGTLRVEWDRISLPAVVQALDPSAAVVPAARIGGSLDARWEVPGVDSLQLGAVVRSATAPPADAGRATPTRKRPVMIPVDGTITLGLRDRRWSFAGSDVAVFGVGTTAALGGALNTAALGRSSIHGSLRFEAPQVEHLARTLVRSGLVAEARALEGSASADFTVGGTFESPSLDGTLAADLRYGELPPATVRTRIAANLREAGVRDLDARLSGSSARGSLVWHRRSDELSGELQASLSVHDLVHLPRALPETLPAGGVLEISAAISGSRTDPRAAVTATGTDIEIAGQRIDSLGAQAHLHEMSVAVDELRLAIADGRLVARGAADLTREMYSAHVSADAVPLRPIRGDGSGRDLPVSATLTGTFDVESARGDLSGSGRMSLADARWDASRLGPLSADVTLAGREVAFGVTAPDLSFDATGAVVIDPGGAALVRARWDPRDLAALAERLNVTLPGSSGGSAAMRLELSGARDDMERLKGRMDVEALDVTIAGQPIQLARPGYVEYDGRTLRAESIGLAAGTSRMTIEGTLGEAAAPGLALGLDGSLTDFAFVRELWQSLVEGREDLPPPAGTIRLRLLATGDVARPTLSGSLRLVSAEVPVTAQQRVTGIDVDVRYEDGELVLDTGAASFEGATLALTGRVPSALFHDQLPAPLQRLIVPAGGPASLSAKLAGLTTSVAAPFVDPATLDEIKGRIDASIELQADGLAVDRVRGAIVLDRAEVSLAGTSFTQQVTTRFEIGDGRITVAAFDWGHDDSRVTLRGGAGLGDDPVLDLSAAGTFDLALLNLVLPAARVAGRADTDIRITGTARMPSVDGRVQLRGGEARIASPRFVISDIEGSIALAGDSLSLERVSAAVNGGPVALAGSLRHRWFTAFEGSLTLTGSGIPLDVAGVRGESDVHLALVFEPRGPEIQGTVTLVRSSYRESLLRAGALFRPDRGAARRATLDRDSPLASTRLDVHVVTKEDLLVDMQEAQLSVRVDLRAGGTVARPSLTGRATLGEGGVIYVGANRYHLVDQGSIDFSNPNTIEPELNLAAVTRVQGTEIRLGIEGTPSALQTSLSSDDPALSRSDLVSLLVTGQTAAEAAEAGVMPGSDLLIGILSSQLLGAAGRVVGLNTLRVERGEPDVRFDAGLVATETDPGARLTVGTNVGSDWEVVLSQSLEDSGGLTWIVSYNALRALNLRVVSLDDGERLYGFQRDVSFGRATDASRPAGMPEPTVRDVIIRGAGPEEAELRSQLRLEQGDRFNLFRWQDDRGRIERYYYERDHFEARVVTRRVTDGAAASATIDLVYEVMPGPRARVLVNGAPLAKGTLRRIEDAWTRAVVDGFLTEEATAIARADLAEQGFLLPSIEARVERSADEKRLRLDIQPGPKARARLLQFSGNEQFHSDRLRAVLSDAGLDRAVWLESNEVQDALVDFYREQGYLDAAVRVDPIVMTGETATRAIQVDEGRLFRIRSMRIAGALTTPEDELARLAALPRGEPFRDARVEQARVALDTAYRARGFNAVDVSVDAVPVPASAEVDVTIQIAEGPRQLLQDVETTGLHRVRPEIVSRALRLNAGEPVDLTRWNEARKRLYETGAFRSVDIEREVMQPGITSPPDAAGAAADQPIRAKVSVQEWPFMRLRYGVDVEDNPPVATSSTSGSLSGEASDGRTFGLGVASDLGVRHLFGRALSAGVAARYSADFGAVRLYATTPLFFGHPITSNVYFERSREDVGTTADGGPETLSYESTLTFEQRFRPSRRTEISYRYSIEDDTDVDPATRSVGRSLFTGMLASTALLDGRNDLVSPTRGWFHSSTIEFAPEALGSTVPFTKYLLQQRYYVSAGPVVFATAASVGLAGAHGQQLDEDDRFFAGGGNSVRGYEQDSLSPIDTIDPDDSEDSEGHGAFAGGHALLVFNQEVRFPVFRMLKGVGFLDAGRAFERVSDMSLGKLSPSAGLGLRVNTPFMLLRFDVGFPLDNRVETSGPQWFFSIGQMF